jgi:glycosyltransferase involved in cell wall biosynthesis
MKTISIGIMAHNEAECIANLIRDLACQTIFKSPNLQFFIHVVANGCTDSTAAVAQKAFDLEFKDVQGVTCSVHNLALPGKANAWNEFVHKLANRDSEFAFLVDADIRLPQKNTFELALDSLVSNPTAFVAVDEPVKDASLKQHKSVSDRLILSVSGTGNDIRKAICGQFYCARFRMLDRIWMPTGIIGEDGFMCAMTMTNGFTEPENLDRVIFADGAWHSFETRRSIADILHHQVRLALGTGINVLLFGDLRKQIGKGRDVGDYIRERNGEDSNWLNSLVLQEMKTGRYFIMYFAFLTRRPKKFMRLPLRYKITKFPIYLFGAFVDLVAYYQANRIMRKGASIGFW